MSVNLYDALIAERVARARSCIRRLPRARFCRHGKLAGSSATAVLYLNRQWAPGRGLLFPFPTFQSADKSMIASNFPLFAAKGIFDLHGRIYARRGFE